MSIHAARPIRTAALLAVACAPPALAAQQPTEIVVIAGNHALHLTRSYGPTELRALLRKIGPDAVGVENFPEWQETGVAFHPALPEPAVAASWAASAGAAVYGVKSGDDVPGWQSSAHGLRRFRDSTPVAARVRSYQNGLGNAISVYARMAFEDTQSIAWTHSPASVAERAQSRSRYTDQVQRWLRQQDDTLALAILDLVRSHQPRRLAIIMGSDHYGPTRALLSGRPEVVVLSTEPFFPLTAAELEAAWHPFDATMILGANLDNVVSRAAPHARDQAQTRWQLERLLAYAPDSAPTLYYLARWHMLFQRWNQATPLLARVRAGAPGASERLPIAYPYRAPPLPTYRALATFALATLYDIRGTRDSALMLYQELLALPQQDLEPRIDVTITFDVRAYLDSLVRSPYALAADQEHGRLLEARRPLFWAGAPEPIRSLAARRSTPRSPER